MWGNTIAGKIIMTITGQALLLFVLVHVIGNSTIFFGLLNSYAQHLHALPLLIWLFRIFMMAFLSVHIVYGIRLTLENNIAKPQRYAVNKGVNSTFASRNMIWTGLIIAGFLVYHLLHFTFQIINPEASAALNRDAFGRPDVSRMVLLNFRHLPVSLIYIFGLAALFLHVSHGIQSSFQTVGLNTDRTLPIFRQLAMIAAIVLFLGYVSIPVFIFTGMLKGVS